MVSIVVTLPPVKIKTKIGEAAVDIENMEYMKQLIHQGIVIGLTNLITDAIAMAKIIVPESIKEPTRYLPKTPKGKPYISERLMLKYIAFLDAELARVTSGVIGLQPKYIINQCWEASYASYVDAFPTASTNWSKPTSEGGFIQTMDTFLRGNAKRYCTAGINQILTDPNTQKLIEVAAT